MTHPLAGERIGILGLARSGAAAARLALRRGAEVYASDSADTPGARANAEEIRALGGAAEVGGHDVDRLARSERIVLSPGIPPSEGILGESAIVGIPVIAEIEFAFEQLDAAVVAITGTNGKTTTTALLDHLLRTAGIDAVAGGNIGTALSEVALREPPPAWAVVEVSSFQLAGTVTFRPRIGVVTNLAPDHLDRYSGVEAYYADKARLFRTATAHSRWVLNGEDERVRALPGDAPGDRYYFRVASPLTLGERGGWLTGDGWLALNLEDGETRLLPAREMGLLGAHNVANGLAAAVAARLAGAGAEAIADGLRSFRAPPHRLEPIGEREGVLWINDSKATNLASTRVALRSMDRPFVLLLGGRHKGEPYTGLLPEIASARRVIAFGEAGEIVERELAGHVAVQRVDGPFEEAVGAARVAARAGDALLLSPACSSFDMFRDYEERGRCFVEIATREAE